MPNEAKIVATCRDTDSIMIAAECATLEECERKFLTEGEREAYRFELFGSPTSFNYGKAKVEWTADQITVLGPKCYFALSKVDGGEDAITCCKWKGCGSASALTKETLATVGNRDSLLRERAPRIRRSTFGVRVEFVLSR